MGCRLPSICGSGDPLALAAVASRFPAVPVIIPHFGAGMLREALMAVEQCGNIHLDTSSSNGWMKYYPGLTLEHVFRQALAVAGPDRILFGTDSSFFPRGWQQPVYDAQHATLSTIGVSLDDQEKIVSGNFDRLFSGRGAVILIRNAFQTCLFLLLLVMPSAGVAPAAMQQEPATLVVTNGKIVTGEDSLPEAQAVAVRGDRIVALGSAADIRRYVDTSTEVIDVHGQLVVPGLIEGHGHFTGVGEAELNLKLMPTTSWDQIVSMVGDAARTAKPGEWIIGRGWHQEKWTKGQSRTSRDFPRTRRSTPSHPTTRCC